MRSVIFISSLLLAFSSQAYAEECENPQTQQSMNQCAYLAWQNADTDLNHAYKIARNAAKQMDEYVPEGEEQAATVLRDAQRLWIEFRDKACLVESFQARGGSMQPLLLHSCMEHQTRQRTQALRAFGEMR